MTEPAAPQLSATLRANPDLDSWVRIDPDGGVTFFTGKAELGQGIRTALAVIGAEELGVPLSRVRIEGADSARAPNEYYTAGSQSVEDSGGALRQAAAEARAHLLDLAAAELGVPPSELIVEDGAIRTRDGKCGTDYGRLLGGKRFERRIDGRARPKAPEQHTHIGRRGTRRLDLAPKVFGKPVYVHDLQLPGMLHARVLRPNVQDARLASLDPSVIDGLPGLVQLVRDGSFVGVITEREEQAERAIERLRRSALFDAPPRAETPQQLLDTLRSQVTRSVPVRAGVAVDADVPAFEVPAGTRVLRASYARPYQMHGSIGPSAALARFEDGRMTVWTASQGVSLLAPSIAQVLDLPADHVRAIHVEGAGCYGHNGADDAALDAALLARAVPGRPVLLKWSRADEHAFEPYGPATVVDMQAALDAQGAIRAWSHEVYSATHVARPVPLSGRRSLLLGAWHLQQPFERPTPRPILNVPHVGIHRNADPIYDFGHTRVVKHFVSDSPLRTSALRSLGAFANVFAIESFIDELAHETACDPVQLRLRHLRDPRARAVIEAAAERAHWNGGRAGSSGRGQGFAFARYKNQKGYLALVLEVEISERLEVLPRRAVLAADAGQIIDPDGLEQQLEGGLMQALSWSLLEEVRFEGSRVDSLDWAQYPILGFDRVPEIECVLLDRPHEPPLGAGEVSQGPTPAALANAIFAATGARLRQMPFTAVRLRNALTA